MPTFQDIFEYEFSETGRGGDIFYVNCKFLKNFGSIQAGELIPTVELTLCIYATHENLNILYCETEVI